jgi:hypothetical protein
MKKAVGCSAQIVLLLTVAALLAAPIACIAALSAPMYSPEMAESYTCPQGTRLVTEWYRATWNEPGEQTLAAWCEDAQGNKLDTLPQDEKTLLTGTKVFFPYAFIPLLIIGALILIVLNALGMAVWSLLKKVTQPAKGNSI